ncbi:MAG: hypothetical protein RL487_666, partial [Actinomycetota bacterium]
MFAGGGGGRKGGGITEEDKLDRSQTRKVLVRSIRMAGEFRRPALWAFLLVVLTTLCTLAGPVLVRHGIDAGIKDGNADELNRSVVYYLVVVAVSYVAARAQYVQLNTAGEGFLRLLRTRVFAHIQR